jgi:hypothetical protein
MTRLQAIKYGAGSALLSLSVAAHAAVPAEFTDAIEAATEDVATMAGALVVVAAVGVAFMLAIKYVKKIPRAG